MKKALIFLLVITLFISCASHYASVFKGEVKNDNSDIPIKVIFDGMDQTKYYVFGIKVTIENSSDKPISVNWNRSSIVLDGVNQKVFLTGQKYIKAGESIADDILAPKSKLSKAVYSAERVSFDSKGGWKLKPIDDVREISIMLCIVVENAEKYFYVNATWVEEGKRNKSK